MNQSDSLASYVAFVGALYIEDVRNTHARLSFKPTVGAYLLDQAQPCMLRIPKNAGSPGANLWAELFKLQFSTFHYLR